MTDERALRSAFRSDTGRVRVNNEDLPIVDAGRGIYGVIDGVGGQAGGEIAASIARDVILLRLARPLGTPAERVREAIALANNEIFRRAQASPDLHGMTCVVTLAIVADGRLTVGHVGDTRLYAMTPSGIRKVTRDHSPVGEREDARELSESEAMRHPRRHEVFRDVGGTHRDKDEADYVDVFEEDLPADSALLLCSDGLSDMVPSSVMANLVQRHAGDPEAVVHALVDAANDAGGKDNITVVYVESASFAGALRSRGRPSASTASTGSGVAQAGRRVAGSRATWFTLGALCGTLAALTLASRIPETTALGNRTLIVGAEGPGAFARITDALEAARPGDVVRVEPGIYPEQLVVSDGVTLQARVPGTVVLTRGYTTSDWVAITAHGELASSISGIAIESTREASVDVGVRVFGERRLELMQISGPMRTGIELRRGAVVDLHGSHFRVGGQPVAAGEATHATITHNVFLHTDGAPRSAVAVPSAGHVSLKGNVFAGFGPEFVAGPSAAERQQIAAANVIVSTERAQTPPATPRGPRSDGRGR